MTNTFLKLASHRRSIRKFKKKKIPFPLLQRLFEAARWAPSACNQQPWLFVAVDDTNLLSNLIPYSTKKILWGPAAIFCFTNNLEKRANFDNIQSTAAAIQNILLHAKSLGLGGCWVAGFSNRTKDHQRVRKLLAVPPIYLLQAIIVLGFPDEHPVAPQRLPVRSFLFHNYFKDDFKESNLDKHWSLNQYKQYLEKIMPVYLSRFHRCYETKLQKIIGSLLPTKGLIIDCNSFYGSYQKDFPRKGRQVVLANLSSQAAQFLAEKIRPLGSLNASPMNFPFKSNIAECCTVLETINHFPLTKVIREVKRVLKTQGKIILLVKRKFSLAHLIYQFDTWRFKNVYHQPIEYVRGPCVYYSPTQLGKSLSGFTIEKIISANSQRRVGGLVGRMSLYFKSIFPDYFIVVARKRGEKTAAEKEKEKD